MTIAKFQKTILDWYEQNRRDMPWRNTKDPYKILVSEIMLQQTQIPRVLPKYQEFLQEFPTPQALAKAPDKKLLKVWAGLGYWRRAKYLKEVAKITTRERGQQTSPRRRFGTIPPKADKSPSAQIPKPRRGFEGRLFAASSPEYLQTLPGIGPYTARALTCFAFGSKEAFIDTNIRRVYLYFFFGGKNSVADKEILKIAQKAINTLPKGVTAREWHYALFDYGAVVLKNKGINKRSRHYAKQSKFAGSFRSFRTKAVRFILATPKNKVSHTKLESFIKKELQESKYTPQEIIAALIKDNLIKKSKTHYSI